MPFIPVPHCWEFTVRQTQGPATVLVNTYYIKYDVTTVLTQVAADAFADAIADAYTNSTLKGWLAADWDLASILVTDLEDATAPQFEAVFSAQAGTDATQPLPPQTAALLEWHTAKRGRSYRGRTYHGGFCEDGNDGQPVAGLVTDLQAFGDAILTAFTDTGRHMAVVSRYSGTHLEARPGGQMVKVPTPRVTGVSTAITAVSVDSAWRTQRRRQLVGS